MSLRGLRGKCFYVGIVDPIVEKRLSAVLAPLGKVVFLRNICRLGSVPPFRKGADVVIVSPCILRGALRGGWPTLAPFFDQAHLMVMTSDDDIRAHLDLVELADGWILGGTQSSNFLHVAELSLDGYMCSPKAMDSLGGVVSTSRDPIWSISSEALVALTDAECHHSAPTKAEQSMLRDMADSGCIDLTQLTRNTLFTAKKTLDFVAQAVSSSKNTKMPLVLSWIIRMQFVFLLGVGVYSEESRVGKILHALLINEHAQLLIISCAIGGWLLRVVSAPARLKSPKARLRP
jgi:hypothetical protein